MVSFQNNWLSIFDDDVTGGVPDDNAFLWCALNEQADPSFYTKDTATQDKSAGRRLQNEKSSKRSSKAFREKQRRDHLNDRFLELGILLDSGTPKIDKLVILADALRTLNQLKAEAQQIKDSNEKLRDSIRMLKEEKAELREEKQEFKALKEVAEKQLRSLDMAAGYAGHLSAYHAAMTAFMAQSQQATVTGGKPNQSSGFFSGMGMGMWQWMPPSMLDTSQDHILRPPVA